MTERLTRLAISLAILLVVQGVQVTNWQATGVVCGSMSIARHRESCQGIKHKELALIRSLGRTDAA